jgi:penicillin-binding protein-related factor A (putative recombinase)
MAYFTKITSNEQIEQLKNVKLKESFTFFYSLFFSPSEDRNYLIQNDKLVLFVSCTHNTIQAGSIDNIPGNWTEMTYSDFVGVIAVPVSNMELYEAETAEAILSNCSTKVILKKSELNM